VDGSPVRIEDLANDRKTESGTFPDCFGCEESLKNVFLDFQRDPDAVVLHRQENARWRGPGLNSDSSPCGHRLDGIDNQVHEDLEELARVPQNYGEIRGESAIHRDSRDSRPGLEKIETFFDRAVQLDRRVGARPTSSEEHQPADHFSGVQRHREDLVEVDLGLGGKARVFPAELRKPQNRSQRLVDLVSDSGGKLAERR
jgi:hypothetical protein